MSIDPNSRYVVLCNGEAIIPEFTACYQAPMSDLNCAQGHTTGSILHHLPVLAVSLVHILLALRLSPYCH